MPENNNTPRASTMVWLLYRHYVGAGAGAGVGRD